MTQHTVSTPVSLATESEAFLLVTRLRELAARTLPPARCGLVFSLTDAITRAFEAPAERER